MEQERFSKTKKALRKMKKREDILSRKRYLPMPTNVHYRVDDVAECIIVSGELERLDSGAHFIRFKLSGQQQFSLFGYQAKIVIEQECFQFEVQQAALLDRDYIEIQLYNDYKQYSDRFVCLYEKVRVAQQVQ